MTLPGRAGTTSLIVTLLLICGCLSTRQPGNGKIHMAINSSGAISVEGHPCRMSEVAKKLKKLGATPQTPISITVPASGADATMKALTRELASAGFRHFVFIKPREIDASVTTGRRPDRSTGSNP